MISPTTRYVYANLVAIATSYTTWPNNMHWIKGAPDKGFSQINIDARAVLGTLLQSIRPD